MLILSSHLAVFEQRLEARILIFLVTISKQKMMLYPGHLAKMYKYAAPSFIQFGPKMFS